MRDVAHVRDGCPPQRNEVRVDGRRAVLMTHAEERLGLDLAIVDGVKAAAAASSRRRCRRRCTSQPLNDQSLFVKAAISGRGARKA